MKEIQEDEVLLEKTDEDTITTAIALVALSQSTSHNVTLLNEKLSEAESDNNKLKDEIVSLKAEVRKKRKVECDSKYSGTKRKSL